MSSRKKVIELARSWLGKNETDGSYLDIIQIYNSQKKCPRGVKMKPSWSWCACTWSAIAIKLGYTDIMPVELSCGEMVKLAKKMGIWKENDGYTPSPGDGILYDWDDTGKGDNTGWPDHIGIVESVNKKAGYFVVIEGNYKNSVKRRTVSINGRYIRGFIAPKYTETSIPTKKPSSSNKSIDTLAHEVISGLWGNDPKRKEKLTAAGYDAAAVQKRVTSILEGSATNKKGCVTDLNQPYQNRVLCTCKATTIDTKLKDIYRTTANLHCRNDAGSNKKALCLIPKGTMVQCLGQRTGNWYLIECVIDRVLYRGFAYKEYLM